MAPTPPERARPGLGRDGIRRWALGLLVVAAIPDVLPYAGLASLVGERFQKSDAEVQLFAVAALLGALLAPRALGGPLRAPLGIRFGCSFGSSFGRQFGDPFGTFFWLLLGAFLGILCGPF